MDYTSDYAEVYDIITSHKDYLAESNVLAKLLKNQGFPCQTRILSVGCGSGNHELALGGFGYLVDGLDISVAMIHQAQNKNTLKTITFFCGSISTYKATELYLVAISLFNVVNCLNDMQNLIEFLSAVYEKISPSGIFFFECWNAMACIQKPPEIVTREYKNDEGSMYLKRQAIPSLKASVQRLKIRYLIEGYVNSKKVKVDSEHKISLFSIMEIKYALRLVGFKKINIFSALPELELLDDSSIESTRMLSILAFK